MPLLDVIKDKFFRGQDDLQEETQETFERVRGTLKEIRQEVFHQGPETALIFNQLDDLEEDIRFLRRKFEEATNDHKD